MNQTANSHRLSLKDVFLVLLLLAVIVLGAIIVLNNRDSLTKSQYEAIQDSLRSWKDKDGLNNATIKSLEFSNEKALLGLVSKDSTIRWLQETVRDFKGDVKSAIVLGILSASQGRTPSTILPGDTVYSGDTIKIYPNYSTTWENKWEQGKIIASRDSIFRQIKITNELELVTGYKRKWIVGLNEPDLTVTVKNLNPNTVTQELRSFNVKNEVSRFSLGGSGGVMWLPGTGIRPYLGVGLNYSIIKFKKWRKR